MTKKVQRPSGAPESIIYIFLDGIGLGRANTEENPMARFDSHFLAAHGGKSSLPVPGEVIPTDAHMGISGLPQSATGQTALFTGYNGPQIMGRHVNGFPTYSLRPVLKAHSIVKVFREHGYDATLLNSYSPFFLKRLNRPRAERLLSASSHMQLSSGQEFFKIEDYQAGRSMYMDITNWFLRKQGIDIPMVSPQESGRKLARLARDYHLVVYEYFFTDKVGHEQHLGAAKRVLRHVEGLLEGVWEEADPSSQLVVVSSDHGNLENLSTKTHTDNLVGTIVHGKGQQHLQERVKYLYDIPRAMMDLYEIPFEEELILEED